jgi:hypothetical protein
MKKHCLPYEQQKLWAPPCEKTHFERLCKAKINFKKHFNLNMPQDTAKLYTMIQQGDFAQAPNYILRELYSTLSAFNLSKGAVFRKLMRETLQKANCERYQNQNTGADVVNIKAPSKLVRTIQSPQGVLLDIVSAEGNFFVSGSQLGNACGYSNGAAMGSRNFLSAVANVARFYNIRRPDKYKWSRYVLVDDVKKILQQFEITADYRGRSQCAAETLEFWNGLDLSPYMQATCKREKINQC